MGGTVLSLWWCCGAQQELSPPLPQAQRVSGERHEVWNKRWLSAPVAAFSLALGAQRCFPCPFEESPAPLGSWVELIQVISVCDSSSCVLLCWLKEKSARVLWFAGRAQSLFLAAFSWGQNGVYSLGPVRLGFPGFGCHSQNSSLDFPLPRCVSTAENLATAWLIVLQCWRAKTWGQEFATAADPRSTTSANAEPRWIQLLVGVRNWCSSEVLGSELSGC